MEIRAYRIIAAIGLSACVGVALFFLLAPISVESANLWVPLKCPLHFLTGIHCPTCGLGRSIMSAAAGEWRLSVHYHPLGIPLLVSCIGWASLVWLAPQRWLAIQNWLSTHYQNHRPIYMIALVFYCIWGFGRWFV